MTSPAEIRAQQRRDVADVEDQLAAGYETIRVGDLEINRETAWAATQAVRCAWKHGARYDRQERLDDGTWLACIQVPIGKFPG